jgi:hypothetical protein
MKDKENIAAAAFALCIRSLEICCATVKWFDADTRGVASSSSAAAALFRVGASSEVLV